MPFSVNGILCTLALLVLWRAEELTEACSCAPVHPQQAFCNADVGEYSTSDCCCCCCLPNPCRTRLLHRWREPQRRFEHAQPASGAFWTGSQRLLETAGKPGGGGCLLLEAMAQTVCSVFRLHTCRHTQMPSVFFCHVLLTCPDLWNSTEAIWE